MLVVFTNKAGGTVEMFEDVALDIIKLMGRREAVPSAISAEDLPDALSSLEGSLAELNEVEDTDLEEAVEEEETGKKVVGLHTRAYPLIELIQHSIQDESFLMWDFK